jgi:hypothetical protein
MASLSAPMGVDGVPRARTMSAQPAAPTTTAESDELLWLAVDFFSTDK